MYFSENDMTSTDSQNALNSKHARDIAQKVDELQKALATLQIEMFPEIMDVRTAAKFLGITRKTLMKWVDARIIPVIPAGGRKLFRKTRVLEALDRLST